MLELHPNPHSQRQGAECFGLAFCEAGHCHGLRQVCHLGQEIPELETHRIGKGQELEYLEREHILA